MMEKINSYVVVVLIECGVHDVGFSVSAVSHLFIHFRRAVGAFRAVGRTGKIDQDRHAQTC